MATDEAPVPQFDYDVFLSYASEDAEWVEQLAERLRNEGVRVWFDKWRLQAGHNVDVELNRAIKNSRKMVAVWSESYFRKAWTQVEIFSRHHEDPLSEERPVIPVCIEGRDDLDVPPTLTGVLSVDFAEEADFDLRVRQLIEALDLAERQGDIDREGRFPEHELPPAERGREAYRRGKRFEDEVATLYRLLGFEVTQDTQVSGIQIDLQIKQRVGGLTTEAIVECKDTRITAKDRDQLLAQQNLAQKTLPKYRWLAVSSRGFAAETRVALEDAAFDCVTYPDLIRELVPLDAYADTLIADYESGVAENWQGQDWFIRPDLETDVTYERRAALAHFGNWLGDPRGNLLVVLGDLGTGKTTLARFLAYQLARSFRDDPLRHPAPVLIPLREVRKEVALDSIVVKHFRDRGLPGVSFPRFEHLLRQGKIVLFFDAFDEMADRVRWEVTQGNFQELRRAGTGKVVLTCRTHYFKDRTEQVRLIGQGPSLTAAETALYKELRQQSNAEVVYLQEFSDDQIRDYLRKTRGDKADEDWATIQRIYHLRDLAQRPLLLEMIVQSLPHLDTGKPVNAANLYSVYTNLWVERDFKKGRVMLDQDTKLALMMELAWHMWVEETSMFSTGELVYFVSKLHAAGAFEFGDEEVDDIVREVQTASFLRRDQDGNFAFMHRSFGEFFLARKILSALCDAAHDVLGVRRLDRKTIYFLTLLDEDDTIRQPLQAVLQSPYRQNVSENALQILYWGGRTGCEMEDQVHDLEQLRRTLSQRLPARAQLAGARLEEIVLEGARLNLADLASADLTKANLNHVALTDVKLHRATLCEARGEGLVAERVDFREADLAGAAFVNAQVSDCDFTGAQCEPTQFAAAEVERARGLRIPGAIETASLLPVVQLSPPSEVYAVAWSPQADLLAVSGDGGVIRLYRGTDGRLLRTLEGHRGSDISVAFEAQGRTLASGSDDQTVKLWDPATGKLLRTLEGHRDWVRSVAFEAQGRTLASGSDDQTVKLWDPATGKLLHTLEGHQGHVMSVAFEAQGRTLASGSSDKTVKLWDPATGKLLRTLEGHRDWVRSVAFEAQGRTLASGSSDKTVKLWDPATGKLLHTLEGHQGYVRSVAFEPQGRTLASGSSDRTVKLWDPAAGKLLHTLKGHSDRIRSVAFEAQGRTLASGSSDQTVKLWDPATGKLLHTLEGHQDYVWSVAFEAQGRTLASGSSDQTVKLWDPATGKLLHTLEGRQGTVWSVAFEAQGRTLASGSSDQTVKLWDPATGKLLHTLEGHQDYVWSVAFEAQGGTLASGSSDQTVKLWDPATGKLLHTLRGHRDRVRSIAFEAQGRTLAIGCYDQTVELWDPATGKLLHTLEGHQGHVMSVAFEAQGRTLASGSSDKTVKLWDPATGKLLHTLEGHQGRVMSVAFEAQGRTLASGSDDQTVKLWDTGSGKLLRTLECHLGCVCAVSFDPNGLYLVAAGAAGRLQFWDVEKGETFLYLYAFGPGAWLALLPDGRFDASPEGLRYLCYTERNTFNSFTAGDLVSQFHDPDAVEGVLAEYNAPSEA